MIVGFKDIMKLVGIFIVTACAVFVCTLFLNYNMDLTASGDSTLEASGRAMYEAQLSMGKVTCAVTGGCLVLTSAVMLMFYVKNYIDSHKRELGILKVLGYSSFEMSLHFLIFGLSVFIGASIGFLIAWGYHARSVDSLLLWKSKCCGNCKRVGHSGGNGKKPLVCRSQSDEERT